MSGACSGPTTLPVGAGGFTCSLCPPLSAMQWSASCMDSGRPLSSLAKLFVSIFWGAQDDGFWARGMKLMALRPAGWRRFVISTQPSAKSQKVLQPASPSGPCLCGDACRLRAEQGGRRQGHVNSLLSRRKGGRSGSFELKWRQARPFHPFAV